LQISIKVRNDQIVAVLAVEHHDHAFADLGPGLPFCRSVSDLLPIARKASEATNRPIKRNLLSRITFNRTVIGIYALVRKAAQEDNIFRAKSKRLRFHTTPC